MGTSFVETNTAVSGESGRDYVEQKKDALALADAHKNPNPVNLSGPATVFSSRCSHRVPLDFYRDKTFIFVVAPRTGLPFATAARCRSNSGEQVVLLTFSQRTRAFVSLPHNKWSQIWRQISRCHSGSLRSFRMRNGEPARRAF